MSGFVKISILCQLVDHSVMELPVYFLSSSDKTAPHDDGEEDKGETADADTRWHNLQVYDLIRYFL